MHAGYRARESVLHTLAEQDLWLQRYCAARAAAEPDTDASAGDEDALQQSVASSALVGTGAA